MNLLGWMEVVGAIGLSIAMLGATVIIARRKNRRPLLWLVIVFAGSVTAFIVLLLLPTVDQDDRDTMMKAPTGL